MQFKKKLQIFALLLIFLATAGCLKTYQEIRLKSDLSGTMEFKIIYDIQAITSAMSMQQEMMGQKASPEQKSMMQEEFKNQILGNKDKSKQEIESQLPEGIKLTEFSIEESKDDKVSMKIAIEFDHIRNLKKLQNLQLSEGDAMGASGKSSTKFLEQFSVEEMGDSIIIKQNIGKPQGMGQAKGKGKGKGQMPPQIEQMISGMMKSLGINFRIRIPFKQYKVAEHNAHKYDQKTHTLYWMYSGEKMMKMAETGEEIQNIYLKLDKK